MSKLSFLEFQYQISKRPFLRKPSHLISFRDRQSSGLKLAFEPNSDEMRQVFNKFDFNKDGKISQQEYKNMLRAMGKENTIGDVPNIFKVVDLDGDGFINFEEFMEVQKKSGEIKIMLERLGEPYTLEDCMRMVKAVDTDGDDMINMDDFMTMMTQNLQRIVPPSHCLLLHASRPLAPSTTTPPPLSPLYHEAAPHEISASTALFHAAAPPRRRRSSCTAANCCLHVSLLQTPTETPASPPQTVVKVLGEPNKGVRSIAEVSLCLSKKIHALVGTWNQGELWKQPDAFDEPYNSLADWVFHGSYLLAFWFFFISTLTTSLQVELLISVPCLQPVLFVASALGTPPYFGAMVLAFLSNLMGGLTHYGIGSAPVFYGANYVSS
uniref:EF-hand domain-containing protein n=1 Tax=Fagus sylvatica TaxID=28930 RepID=A0A2N9G3E4_FAGSY